MSSFFPFPVYALYAKSPETGIKNQKINRP